MRTTLAGTFLAATLVMAPTATADPTPVDATGSSALDYGSTAAGSGAELLRQGDLIGILVLLGVTPIQMLTSGICDLATMSGPASPCTPQSRYR
ncbi:hypothetical protein ACFWUP_14930 [Nocardia sp. NPDC058658]|uniref:hypothetical protein n=1 Tax=Nocardia sp. NPDC058658 TaxID=3346580 RepID=UPI0036542EC8